MEYVVQQQDCLASIAAHHGYTWKYLWNHSQNSELKHKRKLPTVLYPGDVLYIPEKEPRQECGATGKRHRYTKKNELVYFRIRLLEDGYPRKNLKYELRVENLTYHGYTDGYGKLQQKIPAYVTEAKLVTAEDNYLFKLGQLNPVDEISGVQQRLRNMGYYGAAADGQMSDGIHSALKAFQEKHGLTANGELNDHTRAMLVEVHGS
ncbi:MAG: peptidoglycan-binding protein [Opitutus sp.]